MKRIIAFAAHPLRALMKSNRLLITIGIPLVFIASVDCAIAQSRDRDNPTQLTSNEISGFIGDNVGDSYYYTFVAGPGEVTLTLGVEIGQKRAYNFNIVLFELFNEGGLRIAMGQAITSSIGTQPIVERINFTRRQRVLLHINISDKNSGPGKYRLRLGGAIHVGKATPFTPADVTASPQDEGINVGEILRQVGNDKKLLECLPKQGTLVVTMKDGSKHEITLNQVVNLRHIEAAPPRK